MASIRDDEMQGPTGIPSAARRTIASQPLVSSVEVTHELLKALPKTDLHCQLDGSLRLKTILDLAEQQKVRLPADHEQGLATAIHQGEACQNLQDYLAAFDTALPAVPTEEPRSRL